MQRTTGKGRFGHALLGRWGDAVPGLPFHSISVASGKGGTGKSVLTASLASYFASRSYHVTLFDADLGVGNAHILQGISPAYTAAHVASGVVELEDIGIMAPTGVKVLPAGSGVAGLASLSRDNLLKFAKGFQKVEDSCDLLLVDAGAGISDQTVSFLMPADLTLLVTTPDLTAMTDAYALIKIIHLRNRDSRIEMIINRAHGEAEAHAASQKILSVAHRFLEKDIGYLGWIPEDIAVAESVAKKMPFYVTARKSAASQALEKVGEKLLQLQNIPHRQSFSSRMLGQVG